MKNFFEHQDEARRSTGRLVLLFGLAVVLIIAALYVVGWAFMAYTGEGAASLWSPQLFVTVTLGGLLIIGTGSLTKTWSLRGGGSVVAESLGGHLLDRESIKPDERRLLNVVEEMAIASGVPVPPVYLLSDEGINAFAAGFSPDDAVIGVTRGCLKELTREELQGVIAHEFSHILNGDMRINIRLIGILHGILVIGLIGRMLMYSGALGRHRRDRDGRGQAAILLAGLALFVIGSLGFLCGRLIKSAVSRQREFLADASAVQFTRNPNGIAGALKKIAGYEYGSRVESPNAEENSHLFFSNALEGTLANLFSTHPPLNERIRRLDPSFTGERPQTELPEREAANGTIAGLRDKTVSTAPERLVEQIGQITPDLIAYGTALRKSIPETLSRAAHEPFSAVAITYGLLLDADEELRKHQWQVLEAESPPDLLEETRRLYPHLRGLSQKLRLPLMEMAAPALRELSPGQRESFSHLTQDLVNADQRVSVFEYALQKILQRRLATLSGKPPHHRPIHHKSLSDILPDTTTLLSALARVGHTSDEEVNKAFEAGIQQFTLDEEEKAAYHPSVCSFRDIDRALDRLREIKPRLKEQVLNACAHCVLMDNVVTIQEAELLRALAIALDCPLPPFLPTDQKKERSSTS